jgi:hypothetical protein
MATERTNYDLADRVEHLESKNRTLTGLALAPWLVLGVLVFTGQARRSAGVIEANKIVLKDARGFETIEINGDDKHCGITVTGGPEGVGEVASLRSDGLSLMHIESKTHQEVFLDADQMIWLGSNDQDFLQLVPNGLMIGGKGSAAVSIFGEHGAGSVTVRDAKGYSAILGKAYLQETHSGASRTTSAASLVIFDKNGKVVWEEP